MQMATPTEDYYPDHDAGKFAPIAATTVATWKAPAFLENLAIDAEGAVFVTVYSHKRVDRYDPATGARTTLAGPEQGMVGSTACAFGRAPGDEKALYVTTDGGFLIPHKSGIQDAKLVRMEVGESGWPLLEGV